MDSIGVLYAPRSGGHYEFPQLITLDRMGRAFANTWLTPLVAQDPILHLTLGSGQFRIHVPTHPVLASDSPL